MVHILEFVFWSFKRSCWAFSILGGVLVVLRRSYLLGILFLCSGLNFYF